MIIRLLKDLIRINLIIFNRFNAVKSKLRLFHMNGFNQNIFVALKSGQKFLSRLAIRSNIFRHNY